MKVVKRRVTVLNQERPGEPIRLCVNDDRIEIKHGQTLNLDVKFIEAIKNTVPKKYRNKSEVNIDIGEERPYDLFQRYVVVELEEKAIGAKMTETEKARKSLAEGLDAG